MDSQGVALIGSERQRQMADEGWDADHDDRHTHDELARAAACYALPYGDRELSILRHKVWWYFWPWPDGFKPLVRPGQDNVDERIRELTKAGALCAAEIDRLERMRVAT